MNTDWTDATINATNYAKPSITVGATTNYNASVSYNDAIPYNGIATRFYPLNTRFSDVTLNSTDWS